MYRKSLTLPALLCALFLLHVSAASTFGQQVEEVTLEVMPGNFSVIRKFKITFRRDLIARFNGKHGVSLIGKYHGKITSEDFDRLEKLVNTNHFFSLGGLFPSN